jgi:tetratricopeptide (TPR) repeat protein
LSELFGGSVARLDGLSQAALKDVSAAAQALDAGRVDEASKHIVGPLASHPGHPEVLRMLAGIKSMRGNHQEAIQIMRLALDQHPSDPVYYNTMATLLGTAGEFDEAINALQKTCALQPDMALAWYNLGVMLTRSVRNKEALIALRRAVELTPELMTARALLADILRMQGDAGAAAVEYHRVIAQQPTAGMAWWGLADLRTSKFSDEDIATMQRMLQSPAATEDDLIAIGFALAKALDEKNRFADSLQALAQSNAIARRRQAWNGAGFSTAVSGLNDAFTPPPKGALGALGNEVIFIVGLPRSGSTLVEQILASHSSVNGAGELPDLPLVLAEESRKRGKPFPQWIPDMEPTDWKNLGQRYLQRTARWRKDRPLFTDKLPSNWIYTGAIRAMLPGARVIGCHRDPLETCFSCYRQHLNNNEYSRDFNDLASFWRDCDRSLGHWTKNDPAHVYAHSYEALLANPARSIRQLLAFCELPFEETCLNFHANDREVRSPSAMQVRRPLSDDTQHSKRYGSLLDPLRIALGLKAFKE